MNFVDHVYASTGAAVGAASGQAREGLLASFGLEPKLFLFQLGNFIIVAGILWFLILKPLTKKLAERQVLIEGSLENAKKVEENLAKSEKQYQKRVRDARGEAEKILAQAGIDASGLSEEMKAKARKEIEALVGHAKLDIRREKEEMTAGLKREAADLVVLALEKILAEKMTEARDQTYIKELVEKLK